MLAAQTETKARPKNRSKDKNVSRLCIATHEAKPAHAMIRFVLGPDGVMVPDLKQNLPGRGVWVTANKAALALAVKRNAFARSLKTPVNVPADLIAVVDRLLEQSALNALGIARKAGQAVAGFTRTEHALETGAVLALVHASDGTPDGSRKLHAVVRRRGLLDLLSIEAFTSMQLGLAFGRSDVVHAAVLAGPASNTFITRFRILDGFRMAETRGIEARIAETE